jgi:hypothetical protein
MNFAGDSLSKFMSGTSDMSKIGKASMMADAREAGQSFENNVQVGRSGIKSSMDNMMADRQADASSAISSQEQSAAQVQMGADALGSVFSVMGKKGAFGDGLFS